MIENIWKAIETVLSDVTCLCYPQSSATTTTTTSINWIFVASRHHAETRHLQSGWWLKSVSQSAVIEGHRGSHVAKGHCAHQLAAASRHDGAQSEDQMSDCCLNWIPLWFSMCQNCSAKRRGGVHTGHPPAQQHRNNIHVLYSVTQREHSCLFTLSFEYPWLKITPTTSTYMYIYTSTYMYIYMKKVLLQIPLKPCGDMILLNRESITSVSVKMQTK